MTLLLLILLVPAVVILSNCILCHESMMLWKLYECFLVDNVVEIDLNRWSF